MKTSTTEESQFDQLEANFPASADSVFADAFDQATRSGLSVVVSTGDEIIEISSDGTRKLIKSITPPTQTTPGQTWIIP